MSAKAQSPTMTQNPALCKLGFAPQDRVVIVHADDVGMCGATIDSFFELLADGLTSAGSVMVPCPWFPDVATRCQGLAELDVGVHLTLTSEWDGYRWGPIASRDPALGLLDEQGYFYPNQSRWATIDPEAVRCEITAQVDRAEAAGIDVTHIDTHMAAVLHPSLVDDYVRLGVARRTPVLVTRDPAWVDAETEPKLAGWEQLGVAIFDHVRVMPLDAPATDWLPFAKKLFDELPAGLTYVITHPARDTPELRAIAGDWRQRVADFETFRDPELVRYVHELGIHVVGWRPFRDLMRGECTAARVGEA
jgi:predicted glycoside hydrolase/deacetylase ChbG (UPF0249 family)